MRWCQTFDGTYIENKGSPNIMLQICRCYTITGAYTQQFGYEATIVLHTNQLASETMYLTIIIIIITMLLNEFVQTQNSVWNK